MSRPGDQYEQQADRIADRVQSGQPVAEESILQAKAAPGQTLTVSSGMQSSISALQRSGGEPLPAETRSHMEGQFGQDFGQVRIHRDAEAARVAGDLNARAFTVGNDIAFGAGQFAPDTGRGQSLIAHELAHTLQQGLSASDYSKSQLDNNVLANNVDKASSNPQMGLLQRAPRSKEDLLPKTIPTNKRIGSPLFDKRFEKIFKKTEDGNPILPYQFWNIFSAYTADKVSFKRKPPPHDDFASYNHEKKEITFNYDEYFVKTPDGEDVFIADPTDVFETLMHEGLHAIADNFGLPEDHNTIFDRIAGTHEYMAMRGEDEGSFDLLFNSIKEFDRIQGHAHSDEWYVAMIFKGSLKRAQIYKLLREEFRDKIERIMENERKMKQIHKTEALLKHARKKNDTVAIEKFESKLQKLRKEFDQELFESTRTPSTQEETKAVLNEIPTKSKWLIQGRGFFPQVQVVELCIVLQRGFEKPSKQQRKTVLNEETNTHYGA
jgi:hypothetical protein